MKRVLILTIMAVAFTCAEASAQSWLDALKSAASTAIDKVTGGKLTEKGIIGTWNYKQPGVKLSSSDALSELAASAASSTIQGKLATYYSKVGIRRVLAVLHLILTVLSVLVLVKRPLQELILLILRHISFLLNTIVDC